MRLLLTMKALQDYETNFEYHAKVQGFIYSLLRNGDFHHLHDKKGYKFFCFSNIFKQRDSDCYQLIISSPNPDIISQIQCQLDKIIKNQIFVTLGSLFELNKVKKIPEKNLTFPLKIITQSPIITRIPIEKYHGKIRDITPYKIVLWRSNHPVDLFIDALETNMRKKYAEFTGLQIRGQIFEQYEFKKQVSTKIEQETSMVPVIGSLWEIQFSPKIPHSVQKFALDCGFGERNSLGFGFVNPIIKKIFEKNI